MTNDVKRIVDLMESRFDTQSSTATYDDSTKERMDNFFINQLVVLKSSEDQLRIVSFTTDGAIECRNVTNGKIETCQKDQIEDFDKYWAHKRKH